MDARVRCLLCDSIIIVSDYYVLFRFTSVPSFNNHYYAVLSGASSFADAVSIAASTSINGMTGYLVTINTIEEYNYVHWGLKARSVWISATDATVEGTWRYGTSGLSGQSASIMPWASNEPNGNTAENCAILYVIGLNDLSCSSGSKNFVVEFECASPKILFQGACVCMSCFDTFRHSYSIALGHSARL
jgi:hypothetical protein